MEDRNLTDSTRTAVEPAVDHLLKIPCRFHPAPVGPATIKPEAEDSAKVLETIDSKFFSWKLDDKMKSSFIGGF